MEQQVNRRRWERYPFDASVRVVVDQSKVNHSAETTIVDARGVHFSEGGLCLFAAANLPVGSHIKVEFKNPHTDEPVRVRGKVRTAVSICTESNFFPTSSKTASNWPA